MGGGLHHIMVSSHLSSELLALSEKASDDLTLVAKRRHEEEHEEQEFQVCAVCGCACAMQVCGVWVCCVCLCCVCAMGVGVACFIGR